MDIRAKVREWLLDDLGSAPFQMETKNDPLCEAEIRAKSEGILAGSLFLGIIFDETQRLLALDRPEAAEWRWEKKDGDALAPGGLVATVRGHAQVLPTRPASCASWAIPPRVSRVSSTRGRAVRA